VKARSLALLAVAIAVALVAAACGGADDTAGGSSSGSSSNGGGAGTQLSLVAYSTPQVVYDQIIPEFRKTEQGAGVSFKESFGASGDQSRAVEAGLPADVVAFSLAPDMDRLVRAGLVDKSWASTPTQGLVSKSVVSLIVRRGNPKNIRTWDDLLEPGVKVLTPNPFTSGAAKWNILAAYGAKSGGGENAAAGLAYLRKLITDHVVVQARGAQQLRLGHRRRPHLLRERGDHGAEEGPEGRLRHPGPDHLDREPDRGRLEVEPSAAGEGVRELRPVGGRPAEVRRLGLPARRPGGLRPRQGQVPDAEGAVHDPRPRRLVEGQR
jgi:ABC-type molybdate transport system substrate-binding protein